MLVRSLFNLEAVILGHYCLEFSLRIWSAGCIAKYKGLSYFGQHTMYSLYDKGSICYQNTKEVG